MKFKYYLKDERTWMPRVSNLQGAYEDTKSISSDVKNLLQLRQAGQIKWNFAYNIRTKTRKEIVLLDDMVTDELRINRLVDEEKECALFDDDGIPIEF